MNDKYYSSIIEINFLMYHFNAVGKKHWEDEFSSGNCLKVTPASDSVKNQTDIRVKGDDYRGTEWFYSLLWALEFG